MRSRPAPRGARTVLSASPAFSLGVVILAAGCSKRMGRPKLLLPWGATSVLGHLIGQWRVLRAGQVAVACDPRHHTLQAELDRLRFPNDNRIFNPAPENGMFSSIQCAAQWPGWQPSLTHWAIVLGDQPHLQPPTLGRLLRFAGRHSAKVCQPARWGHGRHPVILPKTVFCQIARSAAGTLKCFLAANPSGVAFCELDDPGLELDIDLPEDYGRARVLARSLGSFASS